MNIFCINDLDEVLLNLVIFFCKQTIARDMNRGPPSCNVLAKLDGYWARAVQGGQVSPNKT